MAAATTMPASARSPSSSPRLPSPPPMAEDMTAPRSPLAPPSETSKLEAQPSNAMNSSRRIRPGTKAMDMYEGPPLIELADIDSAFQLTEHLKALHHNYTHPPDTDTVHPISPSTASLLASVPANTDRALWLYELCRFLVQKINIIMVSLFADNPPCSSSTCPEMRASEWQYLCAVHDPPKSCCAIDYCCHTLDWAANTLTSPKHFPSRLALGSDGVAGGVTRQHQERQLTNIFRRVYRIFAHAWFQHRDAFWRIENRTGLYILFKTICDSYALIPEDNYTIPPEAEGLESVHQAEDGNREDGSNRASVPQIAKRSNENNRTDNGAATARKHRSAPSKSGSSVATVLEENEEEEATQGGDPEFPAPARQTTAKPSVSAPPAPSHKPSVERIVDLDTDKTRDEPEQPVSPSEPATAVESSIQRLSSSNSGLSPTSPQAMTSEDLRVETETQAEAGHEAHTAQVAESEELAKSALTKAEGSQATTTEAAEPSEASKTVDD